MMDNQLKFEKPIIPTFIWLEYTSNLKQSNVLFKQRKQEGQTFS